jgi:hypothetical protein
MNKLLLEIRELDKLLRSWKIGKGLDNFCGS